MTLEIVKCDSRVLMKPDKCLWTMRARSGWVFKEVATYKDQIPPLTGDFTPSLIDGVLIGVS